MIRHRATPGAATLWLDSQLGRNGWPVRLARFFGVRPEVRTVEHTMRLVARTETPSVLRIAFASDFHAGAMTDPDLLVAAAEAMRRCSPDILAFGGDYVSVDPSTIDWLAPILGSIPSPLGRYAVLGNHDRWVDGDRVVRRLEQAGIQVLVNRNVRLPPPHQQVWICGLDDDWGGRPDVEAAVSGAEGVRVLLMHSPSALATVGAERFDLALCGHTHGGQIALPGGVPILLPSGPLSRKYARGRFDLGQGRTLIVSLGLGCTGLPLRIFAPPEIVLCRIALAPADSLAAR